MGTKNIQIGKTQVNETLYSFINSEIIPDLDISESDFWNGFIKAANELSPINKNL